MSDDRLFERNARAWLELGPATAPKRVVDAALLAIETTPQQRDLRAPWGFPRMTIQTRFAVAAAVGLLAVGAGLLILRSPQSQVGTPSPSATASPSPSSIALAEALNAKWTSVGIRPWPGLPDGVLPEFTIDSTTATIGLQFMGDIESSWSLQGADNHLTLGLLNYTEASPRNPDWEQWDCPIGDEGSYSVALSTDGATLTLSLINDRCTPRAGVLAGEWTRWPCAAAERSCTSELSPGRHVATIFRPFSGGTTGQFAYTVPSGWASTYVPPTWQQAEWPTQVSLNTLAAPDVAAISLFSYVSPSASVAVRNVPPITCVEGLPPVARTASEIAAWLDAAPYLNIANQTPVTIGGLSGMMVDVSMAPGWVDPCSWSQPGDISTREYTPSIGIFDSRTDQGVDERTVLRFPSLHTAQMARYVMLDRGDRQVLLIVVQITQPATFDAVVAQAMPVIEDFEFIP